MATDATLAVARATTRRHARTFSLATRLLPRDVRDDVRRLYLVFRTLDDLVDEGDPLAAERLAAVEAWSAGARVASPEATVLDDVCRRHPVPRGPLADFCAGMREDLTGCTPATEADVDRYCYRVAGTVGLVMAAVLGVDADPQAARAAIALGMAMQRTNILRDLDEDARSGRCYVASVTLARHGGADALLPGARADLLRDLIARADALYAQGRAGIVHLHRGRRAITAAAAMYQEILRQIERDQLGVAPMSASPARAVVPRSRKLRVLARSGALSP